MRPEVVEAAAAEGVRLIVSVDTGIRAAEVVRRAGELGIDVIVTDHHLPEADLPPALAVLNPNRPDCPYPEKNLCGAGVAFKLAQALLATLAWPAEKVRRVCGIAAQAGGHRHGGRRGAAHRREPRHGQARARRPRRRPQPRPARAAGRGGLYRQHCADSPTGGVSDCAAPECRRPHGYRHGGDRAVPHRRPGARPRAGATARRAERRAPAGGGRDPRHLRAPGSGRIGPPPWSTTPRTGTAACSASWRHGWWSASTARCLCSAATPRTAWRRDPAAAFRHSTCWKPWKPCPTSSSASAATSTPPA